MGLGYGGAGLCGICPQNVPGHPVSTVPDPKCAESSGALFGGDISKQVLFGIRYIWY